MKVYTSYFAKHKKEYDQDAVYVCIAVGRPKYWVPYQMKDFDLLKPFGIFGKYEGDEYERKYRERLDKIGVDRIKEKMAELSEGHDIILLCHERDKRECHRWIFAKWWKEKTGEDIAEWGEKKASNDNDSYEQMTIFNR